MRVVCINNKRQNEFQFSLTEGKPYDCSFFQPDYMRGGKLQMLIIKDNNSEDLSFFDDINYDKIFIRNLMLDRYHGDLDFLASLYFCTESEFRDKKIDKILCS